jgi:hypothetical protein
VGVPTRSAPPSMATLRCTFADGVKVHPSEDMDPRYVWGSSHLSSLLILLVTVTSAAAGGRSQLSFVQAGLARFSLSLVIAGAQSRTRRVRVSHGGPPI